ncbi:MAG: GPR endopeptidase [Dethiobacter sp.]|jgi:spore protease|nr:MAG: GPR endopeptidase [Dethiobacter sp.]
MVFSFSELKNSEKSGYVPGFNVRTDLALEAHEVITRTEDIPGVNVEKEGDQDIIINRVSITTEQAAARMGKQVGNYLTLEVPGLRKKNTALQDKVVRVFYKELQRMLNLNGRQSVLVIGLGNWNVTPDALGPRVIQELFVTRHILELKPEILGEGYRSVCAISPGVLGTTGIETGEVIRGIAAHVKPDIIVAIDALAAQRMSRLHTTIQVSDTGVVPGSGVGNRRLGINSQTMGVPVYAIGVPTVVDAVTIAGDSMDKLAEALKRESPQGNVFAGIVQKMDWEEKRNIIKEVMQPFAGDLIVTPKEIDTLIEDISLVIAASLDAAFHQKIAQEEENRAAAVVH